MSRIRLASYNPPVFVLIGGSAIHGCLVFKNHFGADAFAADARSAIKLARELLTTPALKALSKHAFSLQQSKNQQIEIIHITIYVASILGRTRLPSIVRKPIPTLLILLFNLCIFKKKSVSNRHGSKSKDGVITALWHLPTLNQISIKIK